MTIRYQYRRRNWTICPESHQMTSYCQQKQRGTLVKTPQLMSSALKTKKTQRKWRSCPTALPPSKQQNPMIWKNLQCKTRVVTRTRSTKTDQKVFPRKISRQQGKRSISLKTKTLVSSVANSVTTLQRLLGGLRLIYPGRIKYRNR